MMISPETYYEENLKDKALPQILSTIRRLKVEIGRLIRTMEAPGYNERTATLPSEYTQLKVTREYLKVALKAYSDNGGKYILSKPEQVAKAFDDNLSSISKIVFTIGGFCNGYETRTILFDQEQPGVVVQNIFRISKDELTPDFFLPMNKDEFLTELQELHIAEWRKNNSTERYGYSVMDGTQWELEISYSNGAKTFKRCGNNAYPYNFKDLKALLGMDGGEEDDDE